MHIFFSPGSIRKIIILLLVWGGVPVVFAQEDPAYCNINRGYIEYREVPEAKKGTVIFPIHCTQNAVPEPRKDTLAEQEHESRVYRSRGWEFQQFGDIDKAMEFYKKAIASDPNYAVPYNDLAVIYEKKGRLDLAEKNYLKSIDIDPYYLSAYSNLALLYEAEEQFDKAVFFWKKRLELGCTGDPWTEEAKKHLENLRTSSQGTLDASDTEKILGLIEDALKQAERLEQK